jgi:hypothetical protein
MPVDPFIISTGQHEICGNPYHGLVDGSGNLTAPNGYVLTGIRALPDTFKVVVPGVSTPSRTTPQQAEDTARGHVWQGHALFGRGGIMRRLINSTPTLFSTLPGSLSVYGRRSANGANTVIHAVSAGVVYALTIGMGAYTGHFAPTLAFRRFGQIDAGLSTLSVSQNTITFPESLNDLGVLETEYPNSWKFSHESSGDATYSHPSGYSVVVLDQNQDGTKALVACVLLNGANHNSFFVRSLLEATISVTADVCTVTWALLDSAIDCDSVSKNWEIDYEDSGPQHYSGDDPGPTLAGASSVSEYYCDFTMQRLLGAHYSSGGAVVRRWLKYVRHTDGTYAAGVSPVLHVGEIIDTETLSILMDSTTATTFRVKTTLNNQDVELAPEIILGVTRYPLRREGTHAVVFTDHHTATPSPDPAAYALDYNVTTGAWDITTQSSSHYGKFTRGFSVRDIMPDGSNPSAFNSLSFGWGFDNIQKGRFFNNMLTTAPVFSVYAFNLLTPYTVGMSPALFLENYFSLQCHGWRLEYVDTAAGSGPDKYISKKHLLQDVATKVGTLAEVKTGVVDYRIRETSQTFDEMYYEDQHFAAFDAHSGAISLRNYPNSLRGYV